MIVSTITDKNTQTVTVIVASEKYPDIWWPVLQLFGYNSVIDLVNILLESSEKLESLQLPKCIESEFKHLI